jgi:type II secretory pathway component PulJ
VLSPLKIFLSYLDARLSSVMLIMVHPELKAARALVVELSEQQARLARVLVQLRADIEARGIVPGPKDESEEHDLVQLQELGQSITNEPEIPVTAGDQHGKA